jgi:hypothetical protein
MGGEMRLPAAIVAAYLELIATCRPTPARMGDGMSQVERLTRPHRPRGAIRHAMAAAAAVAIALAATPPTHAQSSAAPNPAFSRTDYEACHAQDEANFRAAIERVTHDALRQGVARIDYLSIVNVEWHRLKFDALIDARVDLATTAVRQETGWAQLLKSLAYSEKAKALAKDVAERVYRSDAIKEALDKLAAGVGLRIGQSIELATVDAAVPAQRCLRAFLGPRYGDAVARVVTHDAGAAFKIDATAHKSSVSTGAVVLQASGGLAGAVILVIRRQLQRMAQRLGQRLVGSALSRVVGVVASGVGLVLIAKDVWEFRHGVLPIIATEMKAPATKAKVRQELAKAIEEQINRQLSVLAGHAADQIMDIWRAFRRSHEKVVDLAEKSVAFRRFVDAARPDRLARIDEVVGLIMREGGEPAVAQRLTDGSLGTAVNELPLDGMQIARELGSLDAALKWSVLAGPQIAKVRRYELHRRTKPDTFTRASLNRLFALDDQSAIVRIAGLTSEARDRLFELPDTELVSIANRLTGTELATLASYLEGLSKPASTRVLGAVAKAPASMRILATARVRDAIIASRDQVAAVDMMLNQTAGFDVATTMRDFGLVLDGKVNYVLLWDRHPVAVIALAVVALMVLLILRRLFASGRPPPSRPNEPEAPVDAPPDATVRS